VWEDDATPRTIERDLSAIGLLGPDTDAPTRKAVEDEILGRAIRVAHRLFRREADGTPIPGWSWGITFTTMPPGDDVSSAHVWWGIVSGDDPSAGGRVIGSGKAAIYSTFLVRTMYAAHALDPPLGRADRAYLDGTWRWTDDPGARRRADEIRCLLDGFASAIGLTLSHEFGHICGCQHDTESPTSIMNVAEGAGLAWADATWVPAHQKKLAITLGVEGEP